MSRLDDNYNVVAAALAEQRTEITKVRPDPKLGPLGRTRRHAA